MNINTNEQMYLPCVIINPRFEKYIVGTTMKAINQGLDFANSNDLKKRKYMFVLILKNLNVYTDEELNLHYENGSQEWKNWIDDAVLFFCYRQVLFNKVINCENLYQKHSISYINDKLIKVLDKN